MELDKEAVSNLNQLDRIEFRQRQDRIEQGFKPLGFGKFFLKVIAVSAIFLALIIPQGYLVWGYGFVRDISDLVLSLIGILLIFSILGYIGDMIYKKFKEKEFEKLEKEYFSIQPKKNKQTTKK